MALVTLVRNRFQRVGMFDGIEKSLKLNKRMEKRSTVGRDFMYYKCKAWAADGGGHYSFLDFEI